MIPKDAGWERELSDLMEVLLTASFNTNSKTSAGGEQANVS